jgi:hypothetical protein
MLAAPLLNFLFSLTQGFLWNQYNRVDFAIYIFVSPIIYLAGVVFVTFR